MSDTSRPDSQIENLFNVLATQISDVQAIVDGKVLAPAVHRPLPPLKIPPKRKPAPPPEPKPAIQISPAAAAPSEPVPAMAERVDALKAMKLAKSPARFLVSLARRGPGLAANQNNNTTQEALRLKQSNLAEAEANLQYEQEVQQRQSAYQLLAQKRWEEEEAARRPAPLTKSHVYHLRMGAQNAWNGLLENAVELHLNAGSFRGAHRSFPEKPDESNIKAKAAKFVELVRSAKAAVEKIPPAQRKKLAAKKAIVRLEYFEKMATALQHGGKEGALRAMSQSVEDGLVLFQKAIDALRNNTEAYSMDAWREIRTQTYAALLSLNARYAADIKEREEVSSETLELLDKYIASIDAVRQRLKEVQETDEGKEAFKVYHRPQLERIDKLITSDQSDAQKLLAGDKQALKLMKYHSARAEKSNKGSER